MIVMSISFWHLGISALNNGSGSFKGWKDIATARQGPKESRVIHWYYLVSLLFSF